MLHPCVDVNVSSPNFPFQNGPLFESEQWIDLAPELVPVGIAHPSAVGTTNASNPNQQKSQNKRLAPLTRRYQPFQKLQEFQGFFQGSNFSNIRCPVAANQMISPRYCDSRISRKWPEWCSFKRKAPGDYGAVFLCNDFKDKTWKKHTF